MSPHRMTLTRTARLVLSVVLTLGLAGLGATALTSPARADGSGASSGASSARASTVMRLGDTGWRVRVLQSRLHQLGLHSEVITSRFDAPTREGVRTFQARRNREVTGRVDARTWARLVAVTTEPTRDALHNVYVPGPAIVSTGDRGLAVRRLQARLAQLRWWTGDVTGVYDARTAEAVRGFQAKRRIPVTGEVDRRTLDRLAAMTTRPTKVELFNIEPQGPALDPRCTTGRAMCVDKTSRSLRWVVDGVVKTRFDVRFGSDELPTREGAFAVFRKSRDHVSSLYDTPMPFAMFFSGGQAVHYSPDFAATGYNGASHGCVNVRDYDGIRRLFDRVRLGDKVIVYRS